MLRAAVCAAGKSHGSNAELFSPGRRLGERQSLQKVWILDQVGRVTAGLSLEGCRGGAHPKRGLSELESTYRPSSIDEASVPWRDNLLRHLHR